MGNARFVIVLAATLFGISCAHSGNPPAASAARLTSPGSDEVRFMGHRLVVEKDAAGNATGAKAWDPSGKEIPAHIVPIGEVNVCLAKPAGAAAPQCEPFSFIPDGTSFKTGTNSICWYYLNGRLVYYTC